MHLIIGKSESEISLLTENMKETLRQADKCHPNRDVQKQLLEIDSKLLCDVMPENGPEKRDVEALEYEICAEKTQAPSGKNRKSNDSFEFDEVAASSLSTENSLLSPHSVENYQPKGQAATTSCSAANTSTSKPTADYAIVFEQAESTNTYIEELTVGHLAFEELQSLIVVKQRSPGLVSHHLIAYLWLNVRSWIQDLEQFLSKDCFKQSCHVLMAIFMVFCIEERGSGATLLGGFKMFSTVLDNGLAHNLVFQNTALYNHFMNIRLLCEF